MDSAMRLSTGWSGNSTKLMGSFGAAASSSKDAGEACFVTVHRVAPRQRRKMLEHLYHHR